MPRQTSKAIFYHDPLKWESDDETYWRPVRKFLGV